MSVQDIDIPEVQPMHQNARFFKDGEIDFVEISFVGSKDTIIHRVTPEHMARFRDAWTAHCDGSPLKKRVGTSLTEIPNMMDQVAENYVHQNVHTMEELAALSDAQCQALGHGTLTFRNAARERLEMRKAQAMEMVTKKISEASASVKAMPADADAKYASKEDVEALNSKMDAILAALTQKKKPGRPPKQAEE